MSVFLYDEALTNRLKSVLVNVNGINIIPVERAFTKSFEAQDNPEMPAVSLYREGFSIKPDLRNMASYKRGWNEEDTEGKLYNTKVLPISVRYQIDTWTRTREQNDELTRDLVWFFTLYPEHKMTIKYGGFTRDIKFNTFLELDVTNNSQIAEFENRGQYYRSTLGLIVDEAQLFFVTTQNKLSFDFEIIAVESIQDLSVEEEP